MAYKFRLCFLLSGEGTFTGDHEQLEFSTGQSAKPFKLTALDGEKTMKSSSRFSLSGGPFETTDEAMASAEAARTALLMWASRNRVGVNVGQHSIRGFALSDYGRQMFSEQIGSPVLEDHLGITIFEAEPTPRFLRFHAKGVVGKSTEAFIENIVDSYGKLSFSSPKAELAAELYAASHFESSPSARFLALFMSLEVLMAPLPRSELAQRHIERIVEATKSADIPADDKQSLVGALAWLKNQSIAQTGRRMANELLGNNIYHSLRSDDFFTKLYRTRNDLVHRGVVDGKELHVLVGEADRFISDMLQRHFVEP